MDLECTKITRYILPAIRADIAERMNRQGYKQQEIAKVLGIVQVAVSKYLNQKYSKEVAKVKSFIESNGLDSVIAKSILDRNRLGELEREINALYSKILKSEVFMMI